jgi:hypothetical protein
LSSDSLVTSAKSASPFSMTALASSASETSSVIDAPGRSCTNSLTMPGSM